MKPINCAKYVYRLGSFYYSEVTRGSMLNNDFPFLAIMFVDYGVFHVCFYHHGNEAMAWRDKHNNIVVRVFHVDTQQKLLF